MISIRTLVTNGANNRSTFSTMAIVVVMLLGCLVLSTLLTACTSETTTLAVDKTNVKNIDFNVLATDFVRNAQTGEFIATKTIPEINRAFQNPLGGGVIIYRFRAGDWGRLPEIHQAVRWGYAVNGNVVVLSILQENGQPLASLPENVGGVFRLLVL